MASIDGCSRFTSDHISEIDDAVQDVSTVTALLVEQIDKDEDDRWRYRTEWLIDRLKERVEKLVDTFNAPEGVSRHGGGGATFSVIDGDGNG